MDIASVFDKASSILTVLSFISFLGILAWTFLLRHAADFSAAAALPFADEENGDV